MDGGFYGVGTGEGTPSTSAVNASNLPNISVAPSGQSSAPLQPASTAAPTANPFSNTAITADPDPEANLDVSPVCFAAGTLVLMADGSSRPIERIKAGELVLAASEFDPEGPVKPCRVVEKFQREPEQLLAVHLAGGAIRCTLKHPFYVRGKGWTGAGDLRAGDGLRTAPGDWAAVVEAPRPAGKEAVFNMQVDTAHTYFVSTGIAGTSALVHNSIACKPPESSQPSAASSPRSTLFSEYPLSAYKSPPQAPPADSGGFGDIVFGPEKFLAFLADKAGITSGPDADEVNWVLGIATDGTYNLSQYFTNLSLPAQSISAKLVPSAPLGPETEIPPEAPSPAAAPLAKPPIAPGSKIALGFDKLLDDFAQANGASTIKSLTKANPANWQAAFLDFLNNPNTKVVFNLSGDVDVQGVLCARSKISPDNLGQRTGSFSR